MGTVEAVHALARFARLATENTNSSDALTLLADTLVEETGADAAAVFQIIANRIVLSAAHGIPEQLRAWSADTDVLDSAFGRDFTTKCGENFVQSKTMLLVGGGGLFGAVVLMWRLPPVAQRPWHDELAHGLVNLAATVLATSARMQDLTRTNEDLRKSRNALARTERLRALGQMAAGVSHDLKSILNPLSLHLQFAQRAHAKANKEGVEEGIGK